MSASELFLGIMSGTSADGIDVALVDFSQVKPRLVATRYAKFTAALREQVLRLQLPQENELHIAARTANDLTHAYVECAAGLLAQAGLQSTQVRAIGCHGQTIRHRPDAGYTLQIVNGSLLAELTKITVVCDFRSRDIAAGGEGAPLVPAFHAAVFSDPNIHRAILNIGGIANVTNLPPGGAVTGFDTGPGNVLLDAWAEQHLGASQDEGGAWARKGRVDTALLNRLLGHPFFSRPPPKSTGRETFSLAWLNTLLTGMESPQDVQATLVELTAQSVARALRDHHAGVEEIYVCGGGAHNSALVAAIAAAGDFTLSTTERLGFGPDWVEACAFAWLARRTLRGESGNLPAVTGARGTRVLGAIYLA